MPLSTQLTPGVEATKSSAILDRLSSARAGGRWGRMAARIAAPTRASWRVARA
jgi:hypothetical protein